MHLCVEECEHHETSRAFFEKEILSGKHAPAIALQVLAEFAHVVTDPKRFQKPLSMQAAMELARQWWLSREMVRVQTSEETGRLFLDWMARHQLGRKRLLDTQLAATYVAAGVHTVLTFDTEHFRLYDGLHILVPGKRPVPS